MVYVMHKYFLLKVGMPRASLDISNKEISDFINTADGSAVNLVVSRQCGFLFCANGTFFRAHFSLTFYLAYFSLTFLQGAFQYQGCIIWRTTGPLVPEKFFRLAEKSKDKTPFRNF